MNPAETLKSIGERLGSSASVSSVFGEPIVANGKTVVPVAKIMYGFGAGGGQGRPKEAGASRLEGGGGGGGGLRAIPAGALEISDTGTRFVRYPDVRWPMGVFLAGFFVGQLVRSCRRKRD